MSARNLVMNDPFPAPDPATREQLVRQIHIARGASLSLWAAVKAWDRLGKAGSADRRADAELACRADSHLARLEAALGDYDRTHPNTGETPAPDADTLTETETH